MQQYRLPFGQVIRVKLDVLNPMIVADNNGLESKVAVDIDSLDAIRLLNRREIHDPAATALAELATEHRRCQQGSGEGRHGECEDAGGDQRLVA